MESPATGPVRVIGWSASSRPAIFIPPDSLYVEKVEENIGGSRCASQRDQDCSQAFSSRFLCPTILGPICSRRADEKLDWDARMNRHYSRRRDSRTVGGEGSVFRTTDGPRGEKTGGRPAAAQGVRLVPLSWGIRGHQRSADDRRWCCYKYGTGGFLSKATFEEGDFEARPEARVRYTNFRRNV